MSVFLGLAFVSSFFRWAFYNPSIPWLALVPFGCFGAGIGGLAAMAPSMTADICDWEHLSTGRREGGMFSAFYSWTLKFGMTVGFALAGLVLDLTGFHANKGALPTPEMIVRMRAVDSAVPAVILGLSLLLLRRYSITSESMDEVRKALENRPLTSAGGN
jgi:GPH family glycoside/pentoside/hexuronide:cation symporter